MHGTVRLAQEARERAYATPLQDLDVGHPDLFKTDTFWPYFDRLRKEDPVHYSGADSLFGPYWSMLKVMLPGNQLRSSTIEMPAPVHRNLVAYAETIGRETEQP